MKDGGGDAPQEQVSRCFKGVSNVFHQCFKGVSRKFQGQVLLKKVLGVCSELLGDSRKL